MERRSDGTIDRVGGYRVVRRLATGGTADVLLAKAQGPLGFERTVVLKVLQAQFQADEAVGRMFAREASAYARLSHPSIVQLYDFFSLEGQLVMVLEYIDGPPLNRLRGMLKSLGQQLDDEASIYVASQILSALAAAHAATDEAGAPAPVIHRDVNPSNVLVPWEGQVKLADFGFAKVAGVDAQSRVGILKGTFGYMAPEQVSGGTVTPRADVYAGAVILWELLTRRRAFQRGALPEVEVLRQMAEPRIVSIDALRPDLHRGVRDVIRRALEPDPEKRRVTAEELVSILRGAVLPETGREHLARALAAVRHEPSPAMTSAPPPDEQTDPTLARGQEIPFLPRPTPRADGALRKARSSVPPPAAQMLAATAEAPGAEGGQAAKLPSTKPSVSEGLDPAKLFTRPPASSDHTPPLGPTLEAISPGKNFREALDSILRDVPSSIAAQVVPEIPAAPLPQGMRPIGQLPAAPDPLKTVVTPAGAGPEAEHAALDRTLALEPRRRFSSDVETEKRPMSSLPAAAMGVSANTAPLGRNIAPSPPVSPSQGPPRVGSTAPGPHPSVPHFAAMRQPSIPSLAGAAASGPFAEHDRVVPMRRTGGAGVVVAVALLLLLAGAGTAGYLRWRARGGTSFAGRAVASAASSATLASATASASAAASATTGSGVTPGASASPPTATAPAPSAATSAGALPSSAPSARELPAAVSASSTAGPPSANLAATTTPTAAPSVSSAVAAAPVAAGEIPPGMGRVRTAGATPSHRVFVDDRVVGQTPETFTVKCGAHTVRIGSSGRARPIEVPCGGEVGVSDR